jgi:hypothetical protein
MTVSYTGRAFYWVSERDGFHGRFIALDTLMRRAFKVHIPFAVQVILPYFIEDVDPLYDTPSVLADILSGQSVFCCICATFRHCYLYPSYVNSGWNGGIRQDVDTTGV